MTPTRSNHSNASNDREANKNSSRKKDAPSSNEDFDTGGSGSDEPIIAKPQSDYADDSARKHEQP